MGWKITAMYQLLFNWRMIIIENVSGTFVEISITGKIKISNKIWTQLKALKLQFKKECLYEILGNICWIK